MTFNYEEFFPYPQMRNEQKMALDFTCDTFLNKNKKFVVLELGTGCGKSGVGIAMARYMNKIMLASESYENGAYILTTQKILQEQYMKDFGGTAGALRNIKGADAYTCVHYKKQTCGESRQLVRAEPKNSDFYQTCGPPNSHAFCPSCPYVRARNEFIESRESITNYSYFLAMTVYTDKLAPRNLLILDEAHNIADEVQKFVEVSFSERFANQLGIAMPDINTNNQAMKWIEEIYKPSLTDFIEDMKSKIEKFQTLSSRPHESELKKIMKRYEMLDKHLCKVNRFIAKYEKDNWVLAVHPAEDKSLRRLEFKPVDVSLFTDELLFKNAKHIILMTATALNKNAFRSTLGLPKDNFEFITIDSPFPLEQRPVFYAPAGKMSRTEIDFTLPKMAKTVEALLEHHKSEKGIIHANTYKIANYLNQKINNNRLLIHHSENREEVLQRHLQSPDPTVLISPSMTEGIDLFDDLSRFQIMCKVPFPYLGDKTTRKRMNKWDWWYAYQTAKSIVQAIGRSIRNMDDYCSTYILDGNFDYFYSRNKHLFPSWFEKVLQR